MSLSDRLASARGNGVPEVSTPSHGDGIDPRESIEMRT